MATISWPNDTLWLNETFSAGDIHFDVVPEFYDITNDWYWFVEQEPQLPTNYPRLRATSSVQVVGGKLRTEYTDGNSTAFFSVYGGNGNVGYGDSCPQAIRHFVSGDVTFESAHQAGGYFAATEYGNNRWGTPVMLEMYAGTGEDWAFWFRLTDSVEGDILRITNAPTKTTAELVAASPINVRMEWQYASAQGISDGWAKLWFGGELLYHVQNIPVWFHSNQSANGNPDNTFNLVALGYWGTFGKYWDNIQAGIPGDPLIVVPAAGRSSFAEISTPSTLSNDRLRTILLYGYDVKATDYTVLPSDDVIFADNGITVTLYPARERPGHSVIVKNVGQDIVTITANGTESLGHGQSIHIASGWYAYLISDGSQWWTIYEETV